MIYHVAKVAPVSVTIDRTRYPIAALPVAHVMQDGSRILIARADDPAGTATHIEVVESAGCSPILRLVTDEKP